MAVADTPMIANGEPVALALGAGGARGLAQIGVIEALQARGMRISSSGGSIAICTRAICACMVSSERDMTSVRPKRWSGLPSPSASSPK